MGECVLNWLCGGMWTALQSCKWSLECFARSSRKNLCDVGEPHAAPPRVRREAFALLFQKAFPDQVLWVKFRTRRQSYNQASQGQGPQGAYGLVGEMD